jgi:hypothetical protein
MICTIDDLLFLKRGGVAIDSDIFSAALEFDNRNHRSIGVPCEDCGAAPMAQHNLDCPHASLLASPDWFAIAVCEWIEQLSPRIAEIKREGMVVTSPPLKRQANAWQWVRDVWQEGDELVRIFTPGIL